MEFLIDDKIYICHKHLYKLPIRCLNNDNIFNQDTQSSICLFRIGLRLKFSLFPISFDVPSLKINSNTVKAHFDKSRNKENAIQI